MLVKAPNHLPRQTNKNNRLFLTADQHYHHTKIIGYQNRPYEDVTQMDHSFQTNHNAVVRTQDSIIHIGDICFGHASHLVALLRKLNGHHFLMDGSHDRALEELLEEGIPSDLQSRVTILPKLTEFTFNGHKIALLHYAMTKWWCSHYPKSYHFYGHSHGNYKHPHHAIDVGVDCHNFFPISIETAIQLAENNPLCKTNTQEKALDNG